MRRPSSFRATVLPVDVPLADVLLVDVLLVDVPLADVPLADVLPAGGRRRR